MPEPSRTDAGATLSKKQEFPAAGTGDFASR
ncbi:hypothetical protein BJ969_001688 [Saccharopolyspora gloriosae]|uniref:Uncharacterized protein n=1 Tax=Saccharopolyspora gloriosae TaxID=455344 RepID=A0A840N9G2_9PSEU|nr:hypothetical protein [Saccharopolyspora gloriosae]